MSITTSRMWTSPPKVYEVINPSSHNTNSITARVHNIVTFLSVFSRSKSGFGMISEYLLENSFKSMHALFAIEFSAEDRY